MENTPVHSEQTVVDTFEKEHISIKRATREKAIILWNCISVGNAQGAEKNKLMNKFLYKAKNKKRNQGEGERERVRDRD